MPISLICGACDAPLTAPDAAAGKRVKCRKCGVILEVPLPEPDAEADYEVIEEAPTMMMPPIKKAPSLPAPKPAAAKAAPPPAAKALPQPAKAKPKPVVLEESDDDDDDDRPAPKKKSRPVIAVEDDDEDDRQTHKKKPIKKPVVLVDDDDEDEDDAPKAKKKGKKKPPPKSNMMPVFIGGGVLGLALVGFLVYWFALREPEVAKAPTPNPPAGPGIPGVPGVPPGPQPGGPGPSRPITPPAGWVEFAGEGFSTALPRGVELRRNADVERMFATRAPGTKVWISSTPPVVFQVVLIKLPPGGAEEFERNPDAMLDAAAKQAAAGGVQGTRVEKDTPVMIDGRKGRQLLVQITNRPDSLIRLTIHGGNIVTHTATAQNLTSEADDRVKAFFDGFRLTDAGSTPTPGGNPGPSANPESALTGTGLSEAEAKQRLEVINSLKQLSLGIQFFAQGGALPPADGTGIAAQGGQAGAKQFVGTSWRAIMSKTTSVIPFAKADQTRPKMEELDRELKRLESGDGKGREQWNVPYFKNLRVSPYSCPVEGKTTAGWDTYYRVFIGNGAAFEGGRQLRYTDFTDGTTNTLLVVEAGEAVPWPKPEELAYDPKMPLPKLGGMFPDGFYAAFADGTVRFIKAGTDEKLIRAWITRNGGEAVSLPPAVNAEAMRNAAGYKD